MLRLAAAACMLAFVTGAHADVVDALTDARRMDCAAKSAPALRSDRRLDDAARRLSQGQALHDALRSAGYRADEVTAIQLTEIRSQRQLREAIAAGFCKILHDSRFTDAGYARRNPQYWVILAAPFSPPAAASAAGVSAQVLSLVNAARAEPRRCGSAWYDAAPPVRLNAELTQAAAAHAHEMAVHARLEHHGLDGSTPAQRVRRTGLAPLAEVGENIAGGAMTAQEVVEGWLKSPGHCANVMNPRYQLMGLAFAVNERSELGVYWAQEFAALYPR